MAKRRATYHHGNLHQALLLAALDLIGQRGADGWTLREAARRAGVSHAAPYRHFRSKEALVAAVAVEGFRALTQAIDDAQAGAKDALSRLEVLGGVLLGFALDEPARYRVMFGPHAPPRAQHPALAEAAAGVYTRLVGSVTEAQQAGSLRREVSPVLAAITFWTSIHGLADLLLNRQLQAFDDNPEAARSLGGAVARLIYDGLKAGS